MCADKESYTIVYFLDYGKNFGGAANTLLQQALLMKRAKHKVILFFSDYFGSEMNSEYKEICTNLFIDYEWATYSLITQPGDIDVVCIDKYYEELRDRIASYHPDVLHSVQINPCVELISRELKIPHIMNVYPLLPEFFYIDYMNIFPHYHLCDSWYYARQWQHYLHTYSSCVRTVVNIRNRKKRTLTGRTLNFICVGAVYEDKNQLSVIKAFHKALLGGMQAKLTLCGYIDGNYGKECFRYIKENDLQSEIIMKGFCLNMCKEYSQNDILICGSRRESYPNAVSEAMANGLVIISTPVGGVPEIIEDGRNGYLARGYLEDVLLEKIMQVQKDIENGKIEQILKKTEETFLQFHSPQAVTNQLLQYYKYILEDYKKKIIADTNEKMVSIKDFRNVFVPLMKKLQENKMRFTDPEKVAQKLWYLYHITDIVNEANKSGKEFFVWGTGKYGKSVKEMLEFFLPQLHISGFIDTKKSGKFYEYKIFSLNEIMVKKNVIIFIAAINGQSEMIEKLESADKRFNRDYFILSVKIW